MVLAAAVLVCAVLARRFGIAAPVLLLASGAVLGFVPARRRVHLPPEVVLLFLPALLYWESLTTSLREIRSNLRVIVLLSTALVIATAAAVAAVAHALGMPWGPAWVLGAAVAPTDATAVGVLAGALPRRTITVLRAESLVNDGTALVIYGVAVGITVGEDHFSVPHIGWLFLLAYGGGALAGVVIAWLGVKVRRLLDDPLQENVAIILIPFTAYLLAEAVHGSGVLAVVVSGLIMSQAGPRVGHADTRQQMTAFWSLSVFLLNGSLFVLVGLELQSAVRGLAGVAIARGLIAVGAVSAAVIGARFAWLFTTPYLIRVLDRRPQQRLRRVGARSRVVSGLAGFRGAVSLAAALAVPETVASGEPFPDPDITGRLRREYEKHLRLLHAGDPGADDEPALRYDQQYTALRLAVLARKRATVVRLRDERRIDDTVLRQIQARLDLEEVRLSRREVADLVRWAQSFAARSFAARSRSIRARICAVAVATATTTPSSSRSSPARKPTSRPRRTTRPRPSRRPGLAGRRN